jgi:hypothetical protein
VFVGESYVLGAGLLWSETLPARMAATFDVQSANCAVDAYSSDQQYMRLEEELPRFQHPVAVVALFATWLFVRNLDTDRPRLDADFQWHEARLPWRLEALAKRVVPYHSNAAIDRAVTMTRAMLRGTLELARSRGAVPLILVPQFLPETASDREIRRRVLDQAGIPYVFVPLDSGWRIPVTPTRIAHGERRDGAGARGASAPGAAAGLHRDRRHRRHYALNRIRTIAISSPSESSCRERSRPSVVVGRRGTRGASSGTRASVRSAISRNARSRARRARRGPRARAAQPHRHGRGLVVVAPPLLVARLRDHHDQVVAVALVADRDAVASSGLAARDGEQQQAGESSGCSGDRRAPRSRDSGARARVDRHASPRARAPPRAADRWSRSGRRA